MNNTCIILAGGQGTRLRSVVFDRPKCLAQVLDQPFLSWQLQYLSRMGVDHFILALGYGSEKVISSLDSAWAKGLSIDYVVEPSPLGTGGAISFAMNAFSLDECIVANGDTFLSGDLSCMFECLKLNEAEAARIGLVNVKNRSRYGGVCHDENNRITSFVEKGCYGSGLINSGIYRVHKSVFSRQSTTFFSFERDVLPVLSESFLLGCCEIDAKFIDIGIPDDYFNFCDKLNEYIDGE